MRTEFGDYVLKDRVAAGGMGVVYAAEHRKLKRRVALKVIRGSTFANEAEHARFTIEAEAAAALDHSNIVPIYEVGVVDDHPFFTMKLIEGRSLAEALKAAPDGRLPARTVARWLSAIARAVDHAHRRGVLHRDLKPGNILIDRRDTPWLTDFGLAKMVHCEAESDLTRSVDHLGTTAYMSPEVLGGKADEVSTLSDVWALGVILWEALCGARPFAGESVMDLMQSITQHEPSMPKKDGIERDLLTLALRCMEKDPARRLQSAGAFADELDRWSKGEPMRVRRVSTGERIVKWVRRKPVWAALIVTLVAGTVSSLMLWRKSADAMLKLSSKHEELMEESGVKSATLLAMEAKLQVTSDPSLAVLLALESLEHSREKTGKAVPQAVESLVDVLQRVGGRDVSPNGTRSDHQEDGFIDPTYAHMHPVRFSPDGRWMVTSDRSNQDGVKVALFDVAGEPGAGPALSWNIWREDKSQNSLRWLGDSRRFVTSNQHGEIHLWSPFAGDGDPGAAVPGKEAPRGRLLADIEAEGTHVTHVRLHPVPGTNQVRGLALMAVGSSLDDPERRRLDPEWAVLEDARGYVMVGTFLIDADAEQPISSMRWRALDKPITPGAEGIDFSPGMRWLWSRNSKSATHLIDLGTDDQVPPLVELVPDGDSYFHPEISPDETTLVVRSAGRTVRRFDLTRESLEAIRDSGRDWFTHPGMIETLVISPDSQWVALAGETSEVSLVSLQDAEVSDTRRLTGERAYGLAFSRDGTWLASSSRKRAVDVWRVADLVAHRQGESLVLRGLATPALAVSFAPDGRSLVATGMHDHYRQWRFNGTRSGWLPHRVVGARDQIQDLAHSPDRQWLALACRRNGQEGSGEGSGVIKLVHVTDGREYVVDAHRLPATGVAISPDGRWLAGIGYEGFGRIWSFPAVLEACERGRPMPGPRHVLNMSVARQQYERSVVFHPRGSVYFTCGDGYLVEWDPNAEFPAETGIGHRLHSINYLLPDVAISPDARWMAVSRHGWDSVPRPGWTQRLNMVLLYDVSQPGAPELVAELPANFVTSGNLAFSPDSKWLAAGSGGKKATLWDLEADDIAAEVRFSPRTNTLFSGLAFSPDGQWLALGGINGRIDHWDWRRGELRTVNTGGSVNALLWLEDGRLVSGGGAGELAFWETDLEKLIEIGRATAGRAFSEDEIKRFGLQK